MTKTGSGSLFSRMFGKAGNERKLNSQLKKYMEFYYPTTGQFTYNVAFDWGNYIITTENALTTQVHNDSKPYLGFITLRPVVKDSGSSEKPMVYLITPRGEVWENSARSNIPQENTRVEETVEKTAHGKSTMSVTYTSVSEPVIDHFRTQPNEWTKLGQLEIKGKKTKFKSV